MSNSDHPQPDFSAQLAELTAKVDRLEGVNHYLMQQLAGVDTAAHARDQAALDQYVAARDAAATQWRAHNLIAMAAIDYLHTQRIIPSMSALSELTGKIATAMPPALREDYQAPAVAEAVGVLLGALRSQLEPPPPVKPALAVVHGKGSAA